MQFRANAYNLANTAQFGNPNTSFGSANFGVIGISQVNDPRIVELALKLNFYRNAVPMGFRVTGRRWWYAGGVLALALLLPLVSYPQRDPLAEGFANPPQEARLRCYWWWLNGNTNQATITRDLEEMKAKGYGGALLVDAGGADQ